MNHGANGESLATGAVSGRGVAAVGGSRSGEPENHPAEPRTGRQAQSRRAARGARTAGAGTAGARGATESGSARAPRQSCAGSCHDCLGGGRPVGAALGNGPGRRALSRVGGGAGVRRSRSARRSCPVCRKRSRRGGAALSRGAAVGPRAGAGRLRAAVAGPRAQTDWPQRRSGETGSSGGTVADRAGGRGRRPAAPARRRAAGGVAGRGRIPAPVPERDHRRPLVAFATGNPIAVEPGGPVERRGQGAGHRLGWRVPYLGGCGSSPPGADADVAERRRANRPAGGSRSTLVDVLPGSGALAGEYHGGRRWRAAGGRSPGQGTSGSARKDGGRPISGRHRTGRRTAGRQLPGAQDPVCDGGSRGRRHADADRGLLRSALRPGGCGYLRSVAVVAQPAPGRWSCRRRARSLWPLCRTS